MTLLEEILAKVPADQLRPETRDDGAIAASVSAGRKRIIDRRIGVDDILTALGAGLGTAILKGLEQMRATNPTLDVYYPLLQQGRFNVGGLLERTQLDKLVTDTANTATPVPQAAVDAVKALAVIDDPVAAQAVTKALEGYEP